MNWVDLSPVGYDLRVRRDDGQEFFVAKSLNPGEKPFANEFRANGFRLTSRGFEAPITRFRGGFLCRLPGSTPYEIPDLESVEYMEVEESAVQESQSSPDGSGEVLGDGGGRAPEVSSGQVSGSSRFESFEDRIGGVSEKDSRKGGGGGAQASQADSADESGLPPGADKDGNNRAHFGGVGSDSADDELYIGGDDRVVRNPEHFFLEDLIDRPGGFSPKKRLEENFEALRVLARVQSEQRLANLEEKQALAKYCGWGGLPKIFESMLSSSDRTLYEEFSQNLPTLISDEELSSARASVNNAHFTPPELVRFIWSLVEQTGFTGGTVLEPSLGVGNFLGLAPGHIVANSTFVGVEKDILTGRIARVLYPDADIRVEGFESSRLPNGGFDLVIGNVPFGDFQVYDKAYDKFSLPIHDYFIVKSLDKLRPGGVLAVLTSSYTMDKKGEKARRLMHAKGKFVAAYRFPASAHSAQSGTDVVTDLLLFVKRGATPSVTELEPDWVHSTSVSVASSSYISRSVDVNEYFAKRPEHILGSLTVQSGPFGVRPSVKLDDGEELADKISNALGSFPSESVLELVETQRQKNAPVAMEEFAPVAISLDSDDFADRAGTFLVNPEDGLVYCVAADGQTALKERLQGRRLERVKGIISIRDAMRAVFVAQREGGSDEELRQAQGQLTQSYDEFVDEFGCLNLQVNRSLFLKDPDFGRVMALEIFDEESNTAVKADIFSQRVLQVARAVDRVESVEDALAVSLDSRGTIDVQFMAALTGREELEVLTDLSEKWLIFKNPEASEWVTSAEYLSGNVRAKLENALAASMISANFQLNVSALRDVIPEDLGPKDIDVSLGSPWVPEDIIYDFICEALDLTGRQQAYTYVTYHHLDGMWSLSVSGARFSTASQEQWGTTRMPFEDLVERALNQKAVAVYDTLEDSHGNKSRVLNPQETTAALAKLDAIQQEFRRFVWSDSEISGRLVRLYNDRYNCYVAPTYDGSHLTFPGMTSTFSPRKTQADAVWRAIVEGNTLLAHEVGAGKTAIMVASGMEFKRLGKAQKPVMIVKNSMLNQAEREARQLYPGASILAVTKDDLKAEKRSEFIGRVANNNWDLVIMTHTMFERIRVPREFEESFLADQISELRVELSEVSAENRRRDRHSVKRVERSVKRLEARLKASMDAKEKERGIDLADLGVDALIVDESHYFKNLQIDSSQLAVANGISSSVRAFDLFMKTRYLFDLRGECSGLIFASGTPVSNNVWEFFNLQRFLQPNVLEEMGVSSAPAWSGSFLATRQRWEPAPSGTGFKLRNRNILKNLPELMSSLRLVADVVTIEDAGIQRPECRHHNVCVPMSKQQKRIMKDLAARVRLMERGNVDPSEDNLLKIVHEGRSMALDPRLLYLDMEDNPDSKIYACAEEILSLYKGADEDKGTQLVFCDIGTPGRGKEFDVYTLLKGYLEERGIPGPEIAFIHDATTDKRKEFLYSQVRSGTIRVLLGSTSKMGEGVNVQDRIVGLHHLDAPWRPSDIEQRDGRGFRQGNIHDVVERFVYTTEGTFDLFMWNTLQYKAECFSRAFKGARDLRTLDLDVDPTYAETVAITSNNPVLKEKLEVDQAVSQLEALERHHADGAYRMHQRIEMYKKNIEEYQKFLDNYMLLPVDPGETDRWTFERTKYGLKANATSRCGGISQSVQSVMSSLSISSIAHIKCGDVPVRVQRWMVDGKMEYAWAPDIPSVSLEFSSASKLEKALSGRDNFIARFQSEIERFQSEIAKAEDLLEAPFEERDRLSELYARQREIQALIQEQEGLNMDEEEDEDFTESAFGSRDSFQEAAIASPRS